MDTLVYNSQNSEITIDSGYFGGAVMNASDIVRKESKEEKLIIHYAQPMPWEGVCYYHVIVDKKTRLLIGWGFDEDKGDPKVCGVAG